MFHLCTKELEAQCVGFWKTAWLCLLVACINWLKLSEKWHFKETITISEEEQQPIHRFVNALDGKCAFTSRCKFFLLQGQKDLLGTLDRFVAPVVPTIALYATFSGAIESDSLNHTSKWGVIASYRDADKGFSIPTGKAGLVLSSGKYYLR